MVARAFTELTKEQQIALAKNTLQHFVGSYLLVKEEEVVRFLDTFRIMVGYDDVCLRTQLREAFRFLGGLPLNYAAKYRRKVLEIFLADWPDGEDAEDCFEFLCDVCADPQIEKDIADAFRDRLRKWQPDFHDAAARYERSKEFFKWISQPNLKIPLGVYIAINSTRLGLAGREVAEKEAMILGAMDVAAGDWSDGDLDYVVGLLRRA